MIQLREKFKRLNPFEPFFIHSPGRINLIGEHTDYNNGFVMPAAIDKGLTFAMARSIKLTCSIHSVNTRETITVNPNKFTPMSTGHWANYLLGVMKQLINRGFVIEPFDCMIDSDLPVGAGLASSAALECGFAFALNQLHEWNIPVVDMITIGQKAEHEWVGVKCGIMDQYASMMGKKNHAIFLDCRSLAKEYLSVCLGDYSILLMDSCVKHSLASSEYNTRRKECEAGVAIIKGKFTHVESLRDVTTKMITDCQDKLSETVLKRCLYVIEENARVEACCLDLRKGNLHLFGSKLFESHDGLSNKYEVSCPELDFLVNQSRAYRDVLGARMMGGGFGGCTINIIKKESVNEFVRATNLAYRKNFGHELKSYQVALSEGTRVITRYGLVP